MPQRVEHAAFSPDDGNRDFAGKGDLLSRAKSVLAAHPRCQRCKVAKPTHTCGGRALCRTCSARESKGVPGRQSSKAQRLRWLAIKNPYLNMGK